MQEVLKRLRLPFHKLNIISRKQHFPLICLIALLCYVFFLFIYLRMVLFVIDNNKVYLHVYLIVNIQNMRTLMIPYAVVDTSTIYLPHVLIAFVGNAGFLAHIPLDL